MTESDVPLACSEGRSDVMPTTSMIELNDPLVIGELTCIPMCQRSGELHVPQGQHVCMISVLS